MHGLPCLLHSGCQGALACLPTSCAAVPPRPAGASPRAVPCGARQHPLPLSPPPRIAHLRHHQHHDHQQEQSQLQLRASRRAEQLIQRIAQAEQELDSLVAQCPSPRFDSPRSPSPGRGGGGGGPSGVLSDAWVSLQQSMADVSHRKASMEALLRSGRLLEGAEQQVGALAVGKVWYGEGGGPSAQAVA